MGRGAGPASGQGFNVLAGCAGHPHPHLHPCLSGALISYPSPRLSGNVGLRTQVHFRRQRGWGADGDDQPRLHPARFPSTPTASVSPAPARTAPYSFNRCVFPKASSLLHLPRLSCPCLRLRLPSLHPLQRARGGRRCDAVSSGEEVRPRPRNAPGGERAGRGAAAGGARVRLRKYSWARRGRRLLADTHASGTPKHDLPFLLLCRLQAGGRIRQVHWNSLRR